VLLVAFAGAALTYGAAALPVPGGEALRVAGVAGVVVAVAVPAALLRARR
jgi:hypothetical protein